MSASRFQEQRAWRVNALANRLYQALVLPDGGSYLATTSSLLSSRNLRTSKNKEVFRVILQAAADCWDPDGNSINSRFWTKRTLRDALQCMVQMHNLSMPQLPGFSLNGWLDHQTSIVHDLRKRANRNFGRPMADSDTQASGTFRFSHFTTEYTTEPC